MADDGHPYIGLEHIAQGSPRLLGWAAASEATSTKTAFKAGDILYGKLRPNLRKSVEAPFDGVCSTDILALRAVAGLDSRFLLYLTHWPVFQDFAVATASGTKMPRTSWALLRGFKVPVPPLPEQRKIAAILSSIDDAIDRCGEVLDQISALQGELSHDLLYCSSPNLLMQPLASAVREAYRYPSYYGIEYQTEGTPEIRGELLLPDGTIEPDESKYRWISKATAARFPRTQLTPGDIVMSVRGTVGKLGLVPDRLAGANMTANLLKITPERSRISPAFLWHVMRAKRFQARLGESTSSTTISTITVPQMMAIQIPLPPLEKQAEIVDVLDAVDAAAKQDALLLDHLRLTKAAVAEALLSGRARVRLDEAVA